jgi:hypothetical protein
MINLLKDVIEERKAEIEWLDGKEKILKRATEMRQASKTRIKAIWCLPYADNQKVVDYMNMDANLNDVRVERLIKVDAALLQTQYHFLKYRPMHLRSKLTWLLLRLYVFLHC